jgi:hypothetical protein
MIRRIVDQLDVQIVPIGKLDNSLDELRSIARDLGTAVEVDGQLPDVGVQRFALVPPLLEAIHNKILPLRENSPTFTFALESREIRKQLGSSSASRLARLTFAKMASVSLTFFTGLVFWTRRKRNPRRFKTRRMVRSLGRSSSLYPRGSINACRTLVAVIRV